MISQNNLLSISLTLGLCYYIVLYFTAHPIFSQILERKMSVYCFLSSGGNLIRVKKQNGKQNNNNPYRNTCIQVYLVHNNRLK